MDNVLTPWVVAATILLFVAAYEIYTLEKRFRELEDRSRQILALEEDTDQIAVAGVLQRLEQQGARLDDVQSALEHVQAVLPHTIQGHGIVRYRAFANVGGDQSFSLALVDAQGNGVIISGLHGRDETRLYAKPLVNWRASHSLSSEEQQALGVARQMLES